MDLESKAHFQIVDGYNQSINAPISRKKLSQINEENKKLAIWLSSLPATVDFEKFESSYKKQEKYKMSTSHFGPDSAFKRKFSGYNYEAHHHGHGEYKFRPKDKILT